MKTSKRFISIFLMLAMLVSVFTVMAFADDEVQLADDERRITLAVGENGKVMVDKKEYTGTSTQVLKKNAVLKAVPAEGYVATWFFVNENGAEIEYGSGAQVGLNAFGSSIEKIVVKFSLKDDPKPNPDPAPGPTPDPVPEDSVKVTATIVNTANVQNALVLFDGEFVKNGDTVAVSKSKLTNGRAVFSTSADEEYTVSWKLDDTDAVSGESYTLTPSLTGDTHTLTVTFAKTEKPTPDTKKTLKVSVDGYGELTREGVEVASGSTYDLAKGESIKFTAYADEGYKVTWKLGRSGKQTTSSGRTADIEIDYDKLGTTGSTLYVSFVRASSAKTLTLDISYASHGDVNWKWYGDRDYRSASNGKVWELTSADELVFNLDPDKGYEVVWQIDNGRKYYYEDFRLDLDDIDAKNGSTLYVSFVKKGSTSYDDSHTLTIDITGAKHGTVKRGSTTVKDGDTMSLDKNETRTFKATPDKGYVAVWTFRGETYVGNSYTVKMGSKNATLYVEFMDEDDYRLTKLPFRDVSEKDWYYDDVAYVYRNGYMEGISSTKFAPSQNTTRGQIVTILWRLTGEPRATRSNKFTDVSSSMYYDKAISWAAEAGIVDGFDSKTFKPDANVTREQLAAILYRYAEYMNLSTKGKANLTKYDDYSKIGSWAKDAMAWANYHGLINGVTSYRIDPKGYATRAQIAAILHRFAVEFGA